jgi:2-dehydro-3-deoxyphosphooctonate aldolase (KDO 8-P synthase)
MTEAAAGLFSGRAGPDGAEGLFLIAGPCVLEDDAVQFEVADALVELAERHDISVIFKASFDKANRSSAGSPRGPGLDEGLEALARVRDRTGLPLITDVHLPDQADRLAEVVDALQIPAFLCRQTDLLLADVGGAAEKLRAGGAVEIAVTERGTAFGYGRWIVDMRSFALMRGAAGCATIFDASHSVQLPGGQGTRSGGEPEHIETLAGAAVAAGADGLFVEVHPDPAVARSDGANMLPLDRLDELISRCVRIRGALR